MWGVQELALGRRALPVLDLQVIAQASRVGERQVQQRLAEGELAAGYVPAEADDMPPVPRRVGAASWNGNTLPSCRGQLDDTVRVMRVAVPGEGAHRLGQDGEGSAARAR